MKIIELQEAEIPAEEMVKRNKSASYIHRFLTQSKNEYTLDELNVKLKKLPNVSRHGILYPFTDDYGQTPPARDGSNIVGFMYIISSFYMVVVYTDIKIEDEEIYYKLPANKIVWKDY